MIPIAMILALTSPQTQAFPVDSWKLAPHYWKWIPRLKRGDPCALMEVGIEEENIGCPATTIERGKIGSPTRGLNFFTLAEPLIDQEMQKKVPIAFYYKALVVAKKKHGEHGQDAKIKYIKMAADMEEPQALAYMAGAGYREHPDDLRRLHAGMERSKIQEEYRQRMIRAYAKLAQQGDSKGMVATEAFNTEKLEKDKILPANGKSWKENALAKNDEHSTSIRRGLAIEKLYGKDGTGQKDRTVLEEGIKELSKLVDEHDYWAANSLMNHYYGGNQEKAKYWARKAEECLGGRGNSETGKILSPEDYYE